MKDQDTEYADFGERMEAEKAALVEEDNLRIRMDALKAAAEVADVSTIVDPSITAEDYVIQMATRFARWLKTGE